MLLKPLYNKKYDDAIPIHYFELELFYLFTPSIQYLKWRFFNVRHKYN
jgi:hypothetical protein